MPSTIHFHDRCCPSHSCLLTNFFITPLSISSPTSQNVIPRGMLVIDYEDSDVQLFDLYAKDWTEASCG